MLLAFTDLETTHLDERQGSILELGIVVTDEKLNVLGQYSQNVLPLFRNQVWNPATNEFDFAMEDANVLKMHTDNGLIAELKAEYAAGIARRRYEAEIGATTWLSAIHDKHATWYPLQFRFVGNSIWFDKGWLRVHMPVLHSYFHRQLLDLTSLNKFADLFAPGAFKNRPRGAAALSHRALYDAAQSLETLRHYRDTIGISIPEAWHTAPEVADYYPPGSSTPSRRK